VFVLGRHIRADILRRDHDSILLDAGPLALFRMYHSIHLHVRGISGVSLSNEATHSRQEALGLTVERDLAQTSSSVTQCTWG